ncbi:hypothetical protein N7526_010031 [Penicillium atrosanguineum]|nr:hypothetical protein N7526_010031 [Penicillium atrosanguineum]
MSSQAMQIPILDHIVILVSHKDLLGISSHIEGHLTLAPGGNHADGLTTNKLILLSDDDATIAGEKETEGTVIDWAFTLPSESDFAAVQQRFQNADTSASYTDPIPGGRTKPDGTVLEWAVCTPKDRQGNAVAPGSMPFWCLDRTPRARRVPYEAESHLTQHPNGVKGLLSVSIRDPDEGAFNLKGAYDAIFGGEWSYDVPSGSTAGKRAFSLSTGEAAIKLVFHGSKTGRFELLPGLVVDIESLA